MKTSRPPPWEWPEHSAALVERYVRDGDYGTETVPGRIERWANKQPETPALIDQNGVTTYADLHAAMETYASALLSRGVETGDRVALQLPSDARFAAAYLGAVRAGAVGMLVHMAYGPSDISPLVRHAHPYAAIVAPKTNAYDPSASFADHADGKGLLDHILLTDDLDQRPAASQPARSAPPLTAGDPLTIGFTSGTVAAPKAVVASHRMMLGNNDRMAPALGIGPGTRVVSASPYSHLFGLGVLSTVLSAGATMVVMPPFTPDGMVSALADHDAEILFAAPAHATAILASRPAKIGAISALRRSYLGGASVAPELAAAWEAAVPGDGHRAGQLFGMTETMMTLTTPVDWPAARRHGGVGVPQSGLEVRIVDEDGAMAAADEEGLLQVRGYSVFAGYAGNPMETKASLDTDGWFTTGDLARRTKDGDFVITGRTKDVINRG
ncbi:MAG: class I adenylate-forming enzyme family protein, partial [Pseudomonadota bacterium]